MQVLVQNPGGREAFDPTLVLYFFQVTLKRLLSPAIVWGLRAGVIREPLTGCLANALPSLSQMQDFPFLLPSLLSIHFPPCPTPPLFLSLFLPLSLPFLLLTHLETHMKEQSHPEFSKRGSSTFTQFYTLVSLARGQEIIIATF